MKKITSKQIQNFLNDIEEVCKKHGLSISHEDGHGGFMIEEFDEELMDWLNEATNHHVEDNGDNEITTRTNRKGSSFYESPKPPWKR